MKSMSCQKKSWRSVKTLTQVIVAFLLFLTASAKAGPFDELTIDPCPEDLSGVEPRIVGVISLEKSIVLRCHKSIKVFQGGAMLLNITLPPNQYQIAPEIQSTAFDKQNNYVFATVKIEGSYPYSLTRYKVYKFSALTGDVIGISSDMAGDRFLPGGPHGAYLDTRPAGGLFFEPTTNSIWTKIIAEDGSGYVDEKTIKMDAQSLGQTCELSDSGPYYGGYLLDMDSLSAGEFMYSSLQPGNIWTEAVLFLHHGHGYYSYKRVPYRINANSCQGAWQGNQETEFYVYQSSVTPFEVISGESHEIGFSGVYNWPSNQKNIRFFSVATNTFSRDFAALPNGYGPESYAPPFFAKYSPKFQTIFLGTALFPGWAMLKVNPSTGEYSQIAHCPYEAYSISVFEIDEENNWLYYSCGNDVFRRGINSSPQVLINSYPSSQIFSRFAEFEGVVNGLGNDTIQSLEYKLNDSVNWVAVNKCEGEFTHPSAKFSITLSGLAVGRHTVQFRATGVTGGTSEPITQTFEVIEESPAPTHKIALYYDWRTLTPYHEAFYNTPSPPRPTLGLHVFAAGSPPVEVNRVEAESNAGAVTAWVHDLNKEYFVVYKNPSCLARN